MLYGWIIFGVIAMIGTTIVTKVEKTKAMKVTEKATAIEEVTQELLERNAALLERASKKGAA